MQSEFLPSTKSPNGLLSRKRLQATGLALEYFSAFEQKTHDFHSHNLIEILYVIKGKFRHITADHTYDEHTGGLTILNYQQYHSLKTPEGPVELMNIYLDPDRYPFPQLPESMTRKLHRLIPIHPELGNRLNRIQHLSVSDSKKMTRILLMLNNEQTSQALESEAAIETLFKLFLIELCRALPADEGIKEVEKNFRMEKILGYLEQHYTQQIRLDELCRISNLNRANLCRRFKEYTGMTTGEYLKQRRLATAIQRLRATDDKILTVCHDSGFSDISRFNRTFKQAFGSSPSEFRKKAKTTP